MYTYLWSWRSITYLEHLVFSCPENQLGVVANTRFAIDSRFVVVYSALTYAKFVGNLFA